MTASPASAPIREKSLFVAENKILQTFAIIYFSMKFISHYINVFLNKMSIYSHFVLEIIKGPILPSFPVLMWLCQRGHRELLGCHSALIKVRGYLFPYLKTAGTILIWS